MRKKGKAVKKRSAKKIVSKKKGGKSIVKKKTKLKKPEQQTELTNSVYESYLLGVENSEKLTVAQKKLFILTARRLNLDPIKREVHCVPFEAKFWNGKNKVSYDPPRYDMVVITGYEKYLRNAEKSGKLAGWKVWVEQDPELTAHIEIWRKDWKTSFTHSVKYREYNKKQNLWTSKPETMIKKVVMAQGFRLAFPEECGGLPYIADELDVDMKNITPEKKQIEAPKKKKDERTYTLPDEIKPETECTLGIYKEKPIRFGDLPLEQLQMLKGKSTNPEKLDDVLDFKINELVSQFVDEKNIHPDAFKSILKDLFKQDTIENLKFNDMLKLYRYLQNSEK